MNNSANTVSVIIPVFNEEKYIEKCLLNLQKQLIPPDEIIIVNNNSTDNTLEMIKNYPIRLITEKKQGMIPARNRGFDEASSEIIARCDADTLPPADWIKKIKQHFMQDKVDALTGPIIFFDLPFKSAIWADIYHKMMAIIQKGSNTINGPNLAITKKAWLSVRDELCTADNNVHEDIDLAIHLNKIGKTVFYSKSLIMPTSGRRIINKPLSFFCEYPYRLLKTIVSHK